MGLKEGEFTDRNITAVDKIYTVWFRYGDNEKDCYNLTLSEDCEDPLSAAKELDNRIYKVESRCT